MTDVTIPLAQAVITGFLVACVAVTVAVTVAIRSRWSFLSFRVACGLAASPSLTTPNGCGSPPPKNHRRSSTCPGHPKPTPEEPELRIVCLTKRRETQTEQPTRDVQGRLACTSALTPCARSSASCESGAHQWSYRGLATFPE
jgi:hypothetical protein